ncbi:hypothetical protein LTR70_008583 [Exophiala xenobiotica]|uniref:Uncharacterized protein n=1 Tax=Lithohypha guttulata TaxID=1690604 RepID=A0ABR0JV55_9EURO|nr:hypothetical protein LTR24_010038 [Lithohypha guttulata]KAK5311789.1 hypothetical protein LTR70_008583 [Exophiala xenobiotica]
MDQAMAQQTYFHDSHNGHSKYEHGQAQYPATSPINYPSTSEQGVVNASYKQPFYSTPEAHPGSSSLRQQLANFPVFPLRTAADEAAKQEMLDNSDRMLKSQQPEVKMNAAQKVFMNVISGGDFMNVRKYENKLVRLNAATMAHTTRDNSTIIYTRWVLVPENEDPRGVIVVDVLEFRGMGGNGVRLKFGADETIGALKFSILGKSGVKIKAGKVWTKNWNTKPLNELAVEIDGHEMQMERLNQQSRGISPAETAGMMKRFDKSWQIPRV